MKKKIVEVTTRERYGRKRTRSVELWPLLGVQVAIFNMLFLSNQIFNKFIFSALSQIMGQLLEASQETEDEEQEIRYSY